MWYIANPVHQGHIFERATAAAIRSAEQDFPSTLYSDSLDLVAHAHAEDALHGTLIDEPAAFVDFYMSAFIDAYLLRSSALHSEGWVAQSA